MSINVWRAVSDLIDLLPRKSIGSLVSWQLVQIKLLHDVFRCNNTNIDYRHEMRFFLSYSLEQLLRISRKYYIFSKFLQVVES